MHREADIRASAIDLLRCSGIPVGKRHATHSEHTRRDVPRVGRDGQVVEIDVVHHSSANMGARTLQEDYRPRITEILKDHADGVREICSIWVFCGLDRFRR